MTIAGSPGSASMPPESPFDATLADLAAGAMRAELVPGAYPAELAPGALLDIPAQIDTPALVVDLDRVRTNLDLMAAHARSVGADLYPHVKTHRTIEYAQMQLDSGARGLTVAKLSEAEVFIDAGFGELVMAYPIAGESKTIGSIC